MAAKKLPRNKPISYDIRKGAFPGRLFFLRPRPHILCMEIKRLTSDDHMHFGAMLGVFSEAFEDKETYLGAPPGADYVSDLLSQKSNIALVALVEGAVVGALFAYELRKFEQARSEIYIYDLAVLEPHRQKGVATALINETRKIATSCGAWVVYVQADQNDAPPIALYSKLGQREDVLHFDIDPS